jgi:hypothetical protein
MMRRMWESCEIGKMHALRDFAILYIGFFLRLGFSDTYVSLLSSVIIGGFKDDDSAN